eukprot:GHVS01034323.1.p1 GENE.GHVS01034323.1~~GHVS01034323.1.p1  ORF type:complete len:336 (-),score=59.25 GHVS01034323.1:231-1238(-)
MPSSPPLIVGHRGFGSSVLPENSIKAFQAAADLGIPAVELDVWLTADQEVVVTHDEFLCRTVVCDQQQISAHTKCTQKNCCAPPNSSIQCFRWSQFHLQHPQGLPLRKPVTSSSSSEAAIHSEEFVPTLKEVLERFHLVLKFAIELKGDNPKLGPKVLEICADYYNSSPVLNISSFVWVPPICCDSGCCCGHDDVTRRPNGTGDVDLLEPLIDNAMRIPLALLFNNKVSRLPPPDRIVGCLNKYDATLAHVRYSCYMSDELNERGEDLRRLVEHLRIHQKKVMTFWGEEEKARDKEEDLVRSVRAGVAAICPNDVKLAKTVVEAEHSVKGEEEEE